MGQKIVFYKYHGTGNDFVLLDQMQETMDLTTEQIAWICHRRFGIGADGLMMLRKAEGFDFEMVYYNSDGRRSTMCGNGGRCLVRFAFDLGYIGKECRFLAVDGPHEAYVGDEVVELHMIDVPEVNELNPGIVFELFTGSPHYVAFASEQSDLEGIVAYGKIVRYSDTYKEEGINVNLAFALEENLIQLATYERGVEDETYSCGTGVTAAALAQAVLNQSDKEIYVETKGGNLSVSFTRDGDGFKDVILKGPAQFVFKGEIEIGE